MWWVCFFAAAAALFAFVRSGEYRRSPAAALFVAAYLCNLYRPRHLPNWEAAWLIATAILLPLRILMVVEETQKLTHALPEKHTLIAATLCECGAALAILVQFDPVGLDFLSFVELRQYVQIMLALWMGLMLIYLWFRPVRLQFRSIVIFVLLMDYACAAAFDPRTGLAAGVFFTASPVTVKMVADLILAVCLLSWACVSNSQTEQVSSERSQQDGYQAARAGHS